MLDIEYSVIKSFDCIISLHAGKFFMLFVPTDLTFLLQILLLPKRISRIPSVSNSLDTNQARCFVRLDLGPNSL